MDGDRDANGGQSKGPVKKHREMRSVCFLGLNLENPDYGMLFRSSFEIGLVATRGSTDSCLLTS